MKRDDQRALDGPAVLIPVKAFEDAKVRLSAALPADERRRLARSLAEGVVAAAAPLPVWVACDDDAVQRWARALGAEIAWTPGLGLNGAVQAGMAMLAAAGATEAIVAHADLPLPGELAALAGFDGITIVPDRRDDGTNVLCVPCSTAFEFSYGAGSFHRHVEVARGTGVPFRVLRSAALSWDIDIPADLRDFAARP